MKKSRRIFMGIYETSGYYGRLFDGLKKNGVEVFYAQLVPNRHQYDYNTVCDNWLTRKCREQYNRNNFLYAVLKGIVFLWAIVFFDTFVFTACNCFWGLKELKLLRILKKKTVMVCLGSFTRLPYADGTYVDGVYEKRKPSLNKISNQIKNNASKIKIIEDNVDIFINSPAQAQMNYRKFISLSYIGLPIDLDKKVKVFEKEGSAIRIFHAASHMGCRGSKEFRRIISQLQQKYCIEYIELSNVSNNRVLEEIQKADIVLDEMYSDVPMATFASEAAWYGKPYVVCGYFAEYYKKYYPGKSCPPALYVLPSKAYETIEKLVRDEKLRKKIGKELQIFVWKYMNSKAVAKRFYKAINGEIGNKWIINPLEIEYINGYGIEWEKQKELIIDLLQRNGKENMGIPQESMLYKKLLEIEREENESMSGDNI